MIGIKREAEAVARGEWPADDNPLVNAPHTADSRSSSVSGHTPTHAKSLRYPWSGDGFGSASRTERMKYWPPVRRVDGAYGDRNLACACPDPSAFAE
jgi:glycine dehydrogenase